MYDTCSLRWALYFSPVCSSIHLFVRLFFRSLSSVHTVPLVRAPLESARKHITQIKPLVFRLTTRDCKILSHSIATRNCSGMTVHERRNSTLTRPSRTCRNSEIRSLYTKAEAARVQLRCEFRDCSERPSLLQLRPPRAISKLVTIIMLADVETLMGHAVVHVRSVLNNLSHLLNSLNDLLILQAEGNGNCWILRSNGIKQHDLNYEVFIWYIRIRVLSL